MLLHVRFIGGCIFATVPVFGKNIADFVELLRCMEGFSYDQTILLGVRIFIQTVCTVINTCKNMGSRQQGIQFREQI